MPPLWEGRGHAPFLTCSISQKRKGVLRVLHRLHQPSQRVFRVAIKHACYRLEKQRILKTGETFALTTLQDHD